jgi:hypothetical protein
MSRYAVPGLIAALLVVVINQPLCGDFGPKPEDGRHYKEQLMQAIRSATRIVVTEHADKGDFIDSQGRELPVRKVVYHEITLDAKQKERFLTTLQEMDATTQQAFPGCIFSPHHTIAFYSGRKLTSSLRICFVCNEVHWDAVKRTPPQDLCKSLKDLIEALKLTPSRDWRALAQAESAS